MSIREFWVLSYLVNSLWQVPLLFGTGLLAARALRGLGPHAEHRVWVVVLFLQSVLPICSATQFAWLGGILVWGSRGHQPGEGNVTVIMGGGTASGAFHLPEAALAAAAIAYCATNAYFAARFLWRCGRLRSMRSSAGELVLSEAAVRSWTKCAQRFDIGNASIASSSRMFAPVTIGIFRKILLLPAGIASRMSDVQMESVIAHEFAHMRRNDFLKNLLYELICLPVSYHPALWFTRERINESREIVCDELAADHVGRAQYSHSLLHLASLLIEAAPRRTIHAVGIFDTNTLERRLMKLAENEPAISGMRRFSAIATCLVLGTATCASALALHMQVNAAEATAQHGTMHPTNPVAVKSSIMQTLVISKVAPKYPAEAKKAGIEGKVVLSVIIDKDGNPARLTVDSGPNQLQRSALEAVRQWKYKPFLLNGQPVEVATKVTVNYTLTKKH